MVQISPSGNILPQPAGQPARVESQAELQAEDAPLAAPGSNISLLLSQIREQDQVSVSSSGGATASLELVSETRAPRRARPQSQPNIELPANQDAIRMLSRDLFHMRPEGEIRMLIQFLENYAAGGAARAPADQRNMLEAIPARYHTQLPQLLQMMQADYCSREIIRSAQLNPEAMRDLLNCIDRIVDGSENLSDPELAQRISDERAQLPQNIRTQFDSLKLNQASLRSVLPEIHAKTRALAEIFHNHELRNATRPVMNQMFAQIGIGQLDTGISMRNDAGLMLELASLIPDIQTNDAKHRNGISRLLALTGQLDQNSAKLMQDIIRYGNERGGANRLPDFRHFKPDVDLKSGHAAILLSLLQQGANWENAKLVLAKVSSSEGIAALSPAERQQLRNLGIEITEHGELQNIVSKQRLDPEEVETLIQLGEEISLGSKASLQERTVLASGMALEWFNGFMQDSGLALALETEIRQGDARIAVQQQRLTENSAQISRGQTEVQQAQTAYDQAIADNQKIQADLAPFMRDGRLQVEEAVRQGRLAELNAALAALNFSVVLHDDGSIGYQDHGSPVSTEGFYRGLADRISQRQDRVGNLAIALADAKNNLISRLQEGETIQQELAQEISQQRERHQQFAAWLAKFTPEEVERLREQLANPEFRAGLSPEQLAVAEARLRELDRFAHEAPVMFNQSVSKTNTANEHLNQKREQMDLAWTVVAHAQASLDARLPDTLTELAEAMAAQATKAKVSSELRSAADALEARLNLAPQPGPDESARMLDEWRQALDQGAQTLRLAIARQQNEQAAAMTQQQRFLDKLKDNLSYHVKQLDQIDMRRHQRVDQILARSLAEVRQMAIEQ